MKLISRISIAMLVAVMFALGACSGVTGQPVESTGDGFSDFTLNMTHGAVFNLAAALKEKNVVLVFWTTWCPNCVKEIPEVNKYYAKNKGTVDVIGVNIQESPEKVAEFAKKRGITYPVVLDRNGDVATTYGVRGIPTVVAIGKSGKILYSGHSMSEMEETVDFK
ncbi:MAG TPA: TlpA disulfide reductase family protein [Candidatus Omnitrophota bacterium]|nr:TlpA disulfide reductase family protein [Candidatus Omnitrophota bacterium]HPS20349.1 TlpA disulfide reductase family protein [Candidatus Omnitrophota bacterium]